MTAKSPTRQQAHLADINEVATVRAWSILEAYLNSRGDALLQRELPVPSPPSDIHEHLRGATLDQWVSWARLQAFWQAGLGLKGPLWARLPEFKELRNLIAHGQGYVRPRPGRAYSKALSVRLTAASLSPKSYAGRVPIYDGDVDRFLKLVRQFVDWAERIVP